MNEKIKNVILEKAKRIPVENIIEFISLYFRLVPLYKEKGISDDKIINLINE